MSDTKLHTVGLVSATSLGIRVSGAAALLILAAGQVAHGDELIPPRHKIQPDRPRLLIRPNATPYAISMAQLESLPRNDEYNQMLAQLRRQDHAAAQAMVWLLTHDRAAAQRAVERMRTYRYPGQVQHFSHLPSTDGDLRWPTIGSTTTRASPGKSRPRSAPTWRPWPAQAPGHRRPHVP